MVRIMSLLDRFIKQSKTKNFRTSDYPREWNGLKLKISFGIGRLARVTWIAFLAQGMKVQKGIYPVYLYYKDLDRLVLAYGVSETAESNKTWPPEITNFTQTIRSYFNEKVPHYGNSLVFEAYRIHRTDDNIRYLNFKTDERITEKELESSLTSVLDYYKSIVTQLESTSTKSSNQVNQIEGRTPEQDLIFVPRVIANYVDLSLNEKNPVEFERRTGDLFRILGFDVEVKGQGSGRKVDVIARAHTSRPYNILVDTKARSKNDFRLSAGDERNDIDHIKNFYHDYPGDRNLETYYLIVSSGFGKIDKQALRRIRSETKLDASFITTKALLYLVNQKLQDYRVDLEDLLKEIFQTQGIITEDSIREIIGTDREQES